MRARALSLNIWFWFALGALVRTAFAAAVVDHDVELQNQKDESEALIESIQDDLKWELKEGVQIQTWAYNPETKKCEEIKDEKGQIVREEIEYEDLKDADLSPEELAREKIKHNTLVVDDVAMEDGAFDQNKYIVVKNLASIVAGEEDISLCILKTAFENSVKAKNGSTEYVHKSFADEHLPNTLSDIPGFVSGQSKIQPSFRRVSESLGKIVSVGNGPSLKGLPEGATISVLPKNVLPSSLSSWASPFVVINTSKYSLPKGVSRKTIFYMSSKLLSRYTQKVGQPSKFIPKDNENPVEVDLSEVPRAVPLPLGWRPGDPIPGQAPAPRHSQNPRTPPQERHEEEEQEEPPPQIHINAPVNSFTYLVKQKVINYKEDISQKGVGLSSTRRPNGKLVQIPLVNVPAAEATRVNGLEGPCGSFHYEPGKPLGVDAFANATTSCLFMGFLQDWRRLYCNRDDAGCRISWGDCSHNSIDHFKKNVWEHSSHNLGNCIDIRPPRRGGFVPAGLTYKDGNYDRDAAVKISILAKRWGAQTILFNDSKVRDSKGRRLTTYWKNHDNHLHICFPDTQANKRKCIQEFTPTPEHCPELVRPVGLPSGWVYKRKY